MQKAIKRHFLKECKVHCLFSFITKLIFLCMTGYLYKSDLACSLLLAIASWPVSFRASMQFDSEYAVWFRASVCSTEVVQYICGYPLMFCERVEHTLFFFEKILKTLFVFCPLFFFTYFLLDKIGTYILKIWSILVNILSNSLKIFTFQLY